MTAQVMKHVVDVHCHPTDAPEIPSQSMEKLEITVCAMSTRSADQSLVRNLDTKYPSKVIPCFGYHPWFSHLISLVPGIEKESHFHSVLSPKEDEMAAFSNLLTHLSDPVLLSDVISEMRANLTDFPDAFVGEVGLDRIFRVPLDYFAERRVLTPFTISIDHQTAILEAQIDLAVELGRSISIHSVKSQLNTVQVLDKMAKKHGDRWRTISFDMHSCGLSPQTWLDIQRRHPNAFLSLSQVINGRSPNHRALIKACAPNRILAESDYNDIDMSMSQTWKIILTIAEEKQWEVEEEWLEDVPDESKWGVVRRLEENWRLFRAGNHT